MRRLRLRRSVEKTWPELRALLSGGAPGFVYGSRAVGALPVFVFHRVDASFEAALRRLAEGGFRTAGAEELERAARGERADPRAVALTFDDGDASLVEVAVPLLERHDFRALAFVVAGLVPETTRDGLAGWSELRSAVRRGVLEVGSHSLHHHHVPVSPRVLDFVTPETDTRFTASLPIPRVRGDGTLPPGTPIHPGAPRYAARPAFLPDPEAAARCVRIVGEAGPGFFRMDGWRRRLRNAAGAPEGRRESGAELEAAVRRDIETSLALVAERCPNRGQDHLCYPWFVGAERVDQWAGESGVRLLHKGIDARPRPACRAGGLPPAVRRLPPDFLGRLPGPGRRPLLDFATSRLRALTFGAA